MEFSSRGNPKTRVCYSFIYELNLKSRTATTGYYPLCGGVPYHHFAFHGAFGRLSGIMTRSIYFLTTYMEARGADPGAEKMANVVVKRLSPQPSGYSNPAILFAAWPFRKIPPHCRLRDGQCAELLPQNKLSVLSPDTLATISSVSQN